jgi:ParB/RepB/Spo0J family partition protein
VTIRRRDQQIQPTEYHQEHPMKSTKALALKDPVIVADELVMDEGHYARTELARIRISPDNRKRFDEIKLQELAASIKAMGVAQPILLRPVDPTESAPQEFEIVAGERRYRASIIAGMFDIPAMVRKLTDLQAAKIRILENLQREDPHPMEEAEGYQQLMLQHGYSADQLAEEIKRSRSYVFGRLKLCALTTDVREQFLGDKVPASIALLIARIPVPALQVKALAEIITPQYGEPLSVRKAAQHLQYRYMLDLTSATFPIADAKLLATAGACTKCPKRTGNQPEIFEGISADVCTDPDCFAEKKGALVARKIAEAGKKGIPVFEDQDEWKALAKSDNLVTAREQLYNFELCSPAIQNWTQLEAVIEPDQLPAPKAFALIAGVLVPLYEKTAVQHALEKAGICEAEEGRASREAAEASARVEQANAAPEGGAAPNAARLAKMKAEEEARRKKEGIAQNEMSFRISLYKQFRSRAANGLSLQSLREFVKLVLTDDNSYSVPDDILDVYGLESYSDVAVAAHIDQATLPEVQLILIDLVLGECLHVETNDVEEDGTIDDDDYCNGQARIAALLAMASHEGIDPVQLKETMFPTPINVDTWAEADLMSFITTYPNRLDELTTIVMAHQRGELTGMLERAAGFLGYVYVDRSFQLKQAAPEVETPPAAGATASSDAVPNPEDGDIAACDGEDLEAAMAEPAPAKKAAKVKPAAKKISVPATPAATPEPTGKGRLAPVAAWPFPKSSKDALPLAAATNSTTANPSTKEAA